MLSNALTPLAALNAHMMTPVHPTAYPFPWATTLHALRVSLAYRGICKGFKARRRAQGKKDDELQVGMLREAAGFLVMAWGGSFLSNYILTQIPGQLISVQPWLNYLSVHYAVGFLLTLFPAPSARLLDLCLPVLDGATRTAATLGGINLVLNHVNPAVRSSWLLQVLIATISASGGGISAFTLNVFDPVGWSFSTPPFLTFSRLVEFTDILAPMIAALAFGVVTQSHPAYTNLVQSSSLTSLLGVHGAKMSAPAFSPDRARALVTLIIATCFWAKAMVTHLLAPVTPPASASTSVKKIAAPARSSGSRASTPSTPSTRSRKAANKVEA
ncbi:uncharacterized protein PFL1_05131 [Pseudozyma flocculosa PF-1]|uniref:Uncharacterized protein n=2 Tax=Pseudozyma flocculosa TaxID=84751 RepID=A0A5C3F8A4_9BASI|nr:uncharacterized protein PFL1_05131 [Pseudozyma flocculosa PF-1]EPQ27208.1 hypothetical protein PFL1_05131 [Pseudozyma flocculosa PF-1]SPO39571.1 uncharacterized protein PSFLO_05052 [Pseudozyma flocculosa]